MPAGPGRRRAPAVRAAVAAALPSTACSLVPPLARAQAAADEAEGRFATETPAGALYGEDAVDLQRQINELRSDLLTSARGGSNG